MNRIKRQITINERGGDQFGDVSAAQAGAMDSLARDITQTIRRMIDSGALTVCDGRVIVSKDKKQ